MIMELKTSSYTFTGQSASFGATTNPTLSPIGTLTVDNTLVSAVLVWETNVYEEAKTFEYEYKSNTTFQETLVSSCSVDGAVPIDYNITSADDQFVPDWINFNDTDLIISGTTPETLEDTTYNLNLFSNWTVQPLGNTNQSITIKIKGTKIPVTTSGKVAVAATHAQTAAVGAISVISSVLNGSAPTALWAIIQQLQMVILILLIDDYTPEDIDNYLEGVGFVMFNFNFIPATDIPFVDIPTDWMTFGDPFDKVEKLGFDSISTFVNNVSLLLSFILLFTIHMLLK